MIKWRALHFGIVLGFSMSLVSAAGGQAPQQPRPTQGGGSGQPPRAGDRGKPGNQNGSGPNRPQPPNPNPGQGSPGRPQVQPPGPAPGNNRPGPGNNRPAPGGSNRPGQGNAGGPQVQPPRPSPGGGNGNRPNPGSRPGGRPNRPAQWGRPPQQRPSYRFRPTDRAYLRRFYLSRLRSINLARRPVFAPGGYFPYADIVYLSTLPPNLYGYLPPPPPGYSMGYFEGYVVVYDPNTYYVADVIDLVQ